MSAVAHVSELAQSVDPLQYVRASPQGIPDEHLNPSPEVVRLVHAPAGDTTGEGYTCTVHLPSSLPPEGVGMVKSGGATPVISQRHRCLGECQHHAGVLCSACDQKGPPGGCQSRNQPVRSTSRGRDPSHHTGLGSGSGTGLDVEALPGPSRFGREQTGCPPDR